MTQIKICGFTSREGLESAAQLGIEYAGFVFAASKRQMDPQRVATMTREIRSFKRIGVFVNEPLENLLRIAEIAQLDGFQLHGNESPEFCQRLKERTNKLIWKAWRVGADQSADFLKEYRFSADALLLDAYHPKQMGGTGQPFAWDSIPSIRHLVPGVPLIVAGGLSADNVGRLIDTYRPEAVDVSSGVETGGVKDPEKMKQFVERVREKA